MEIKVEYARILKNHHFEDMVLDKLALLSAKYSFIKSASVLLKYDSILFETGCICEVKLHGLEDNLWATSHKASFEQAISTAVLELDMELGLAISKDYN